ncbi:MAG TPA: isocitrate lyase/phosphoenolpyruvate mutase family protein [Candidatus Baltobacteraceae bacterium]|nr:isocitrate lyase/phosphoenolpyruvate mutase family protein [Candidatus Baltobacteraceae bacterium]
MPTQEEKGRAFRALHERDHAFIIPNPYDIGTARILAHVGFEALASTSMGYAFTQGRPDYGLQRGDVLAHLKLLAAATDLPVSADLENGFGDDPTTVAETIAMTAATGIVGGSIEDATGRAGAPIYPLDVAVERIRAAVAAARALPFTFTLTARCENYLHDREDLDDTIARLRAYEEAGADVLYAPGLETAADITAVVKSVRKPVNVLGGFAQLSLAELSAIGVKRVSVGSSLNIAALSAFTRAAQEMKEHGTFTYAKSSVSSSQFTNIFARR